MVASINMRKLFESDESDSDAILSNANFITADKNPTHSIVK